MTTTADRIAAAFHGAYETLAPEFGYKTREASAVPWADVPEANKRLMTAVVDELLDRAVIAVPTAPAVSKPVTAPECADRAAAALAEARSLAGVQPAAAGALVAVAGGWRELGEALASNGRMNRTTDDEQ